MRISPILLKKLSFITWVVSYLNSLLLSLAAFRTSTDVYSHMCGFWSQLVEYGQHLYYHLVLCPIPGSMATFLLIYALISCWIQQLSSWCPTSHQCKRSGILLAIIWFIFLPWKLYTSPQDLPNHLIIQYHLSLFFCGLF